MPVELRPMEDQAPERQAALRESRGATCSESAVERWECAFCGKDHPCRVEINFTRTPYPHVEAQPRFTRRVCLCDESRITDWKQIQNAAITGGDSRPVHWMVGETQDTED